MTRLEAKRIYDNAKRNKDRMTAIQKPGNIAWRKDLQEDLKSTWYIKGHPQRPIIEDETQAHAKDSIVPHKHKTKTKAETL